MSNFKITDLTAIPSVDRAVNVMEIVDVAGNVSYKVTPNNLLGFTGGNPVSTSDTQALTNKTLTAPTIASPILSGTITGTYTLAGTPTFPAAVTTLTGSQTLTNKILTSPTINAPTITNASITADALTGFSVANTGTIYGISVTAAAISSALSLTSTLTVTGATILSSTLGTVGQLSTQTGTAPPAAGANTAGIKLSSTANLGVFFGAGAPTFTAAQGSIYINTTGSSTSTRLYVNTTGSTTWASFTSSA